MAFLDAGAHAVVHTYWPVRDDAAAAFMARFIAYYAVTKNPVAALTMARQETEKEGLDSRQWLAYAVMVGSVDFDPAPARA